MALFPYLKAFHIIFVVTWFAGLFYIVRLFIYQVEAMERPENERNILLPQLKLMTNRLWVIITWPSAIITLILGIVVLYLQSWHLDFAYMWVKLGFVLLLYIYHLLCHRIYLKLQNDSIPMSSDRLRMWNEIATVLLIAIVLLIVVRTALSVVWGIVGLFGTMALLIILIKWYKKLREKK